MNASIFILSILLMGGAPKVEVSEQNFDFGYAFVNGYYRHTFWLYNRGDAPLTIRNIRTFCNCTATKLNKKLLLPGDSTSFDFIFDSQGFFAERIKWANVFSDDPVDSLLQVNILIRLYSDYDRIPLKVEPEMLNFNRIDSLRDEVTLKISNPTRTSYMLRLVETSPALEAFEFPQRTLAPGEEVTLVLHPKAGIKDAKLFQSAVSFEGWTPTEVFRFSIPLLIRPVP